MTDQATTQDFLARLDVQMLGPDRFSATCLPAWPGRAFGGQLAAHALQAAARTVDTALVPWSLHTHFHAPVRTLEPVEYVVETVKSGRTLASRRVQVLQDDKLRASALALFGVEGDGPSHQFDVPDTTPPEELTSDDWILDHSIVAEDADFDALGYPPLPLLEVRSVPLTPTADDPYARQVWMRTIPELPSDTLTTASVLCAFADLTLGTTALAPHGGRAQSADLQMGALELAMWFTAPARLHEWTLCAESTAFAGGGHGLAHGVFFNSEQRVSAIAIQNALMRSRA